MHLISGSPMTVEDLKKGPLSNFRIYMGRKTLSAYSRLKAKNNDNIGPDLGRFGGTLAFNRVPVEHAPELNEDVDAPIYGVNHDHFFPYVMEGDWMRESEPQFDVQQPEVITVNLIGQYQFFADNVREAGFVGSKIPTT